MKILHVISSVDPKGGGVIAVVNQFALLHIELGHLVEICSLDSPNAEFVATSAIPVHALGPARLSYYYSDRLIPWLKIHSSQYDVVIVHGLWQFTSIAVWHVLRRSSTPYFVFPHGMLGPWFKQVYPWKHYKKWIYWLVAEYRVLRDAKSVIFTCEDERFLARDSFWLYSVRESVSGFGIAKVPIAKDVVQAGFLCRYPELANKRIVLFLGRIHEVKGCDMLIEAFAKVKSLHQGLHLVMAGPDQTEWVARLKAQALGLGIADRITWLGMVKDEVKWSAIYSAEVLCLPSHHENFGVVVVEALACGKPVLISDKVNIWRNIESEQSGFVDSDTVDGIVRNLGRWLALSKDEYILMANRAIETYENYFHIEQAAQQLLDIVSRARPCE